MRPQRMEMQLKRHYSKMKVIYRGFRAFVGKGIVAKKTVILDGSTDAGCADPIFIVGTHRSGTSLVRRILDSHKNIACPPESYFLVSYSEMLQNKEVLLGLENLGFSGAEVTKAMRKSAAYFHEAYRRAKGKSRWADKTPQYVFHLNELFELFGQGAKFVFVFRHPLDVACSLWGRGWVFWDESGDRLGDVCRYVKDSMARQMDFLRQNPDKCFVVYYDALVERPESELRALMEFLAEPWDPVLLRHHEMHHDFGIEDPISRGTRGFNGSYMNWKSWTNDQLVKATGILEETISDMGYAAESPHVKVRC